jgi:hypothetical protein
VTAQPPPPPPRPVEPENLHDEQTIRRIAAYEKISACLWLAIAILQVLSLWGIVAGIWNLMACYSRFQMVGRIRRREPSVPGDYEGILHLVALALVNLFLGGVIGAPIVVFDFVIRDKVLSNRHLFDYVDVEKVAATIAG